MRPSTTAPFPWPNNSGKLLLSLAQWHVSPLLLGQLLLSYSFTSNYTTLPPGQLEAAPSPRPLASLATNFHGQPSQPRQTHHATSYPRPCTAVVCTTIKVIHAASPPLLGHMHTTPSCARPLYAASCERPLYAILHALQSKKGSIAFMYMTILLGLHVHGQIPQLKLLAHHAPRPRLVRSLHASSSTWPKVTRPLHARHAMRHIHNTANISLASRLTSVVDEQQQKKKKRE